jgi:hypothetical protein
MTLNSARLNHPTTALSSGHGLSLRLHRTVTAVQGGAATFRSSLMVMAFCLLLVLWVG